jgi:hypothetical protein
MSFVIKSITPEPDGRDYYVGRLGWAGSIIVRSADPKRAKTFRSRKAAEFEAEETFNPGFMHVVPAPDEATFVATMFGGRRAEFVDAAGRKVE